MKTISLNSMLIAIILVAISGLLKAQDDAATIFKVVVNHEGDYFIWPAERELPVAAWKDAGK